MSIHLISLRLTLCRRAGACPSISWTKGNTLARWPVRHNKLYLRLNYILALKVLYFHCQFESFTDNVIRNKTGYYP